MPDETEIPTPEEVTETPPEQTGGETSPPEGGSESPAGTDENAGSGEDPQPGEDVGEDSGEVTLAEEIEAIVTANISKPNRGVMRMRVRRKVGQLLRQKFGYMYSVAVRATPDRGGVHVKSKTPEGLVVVTVAVPQIAE